MTCSCAAAAAAMCGITLRRRPAARCLAAAAAGETGPAVLSGVRELSSRYRYFTLDQFGVMHDGTNAYPGALDCLGELHAAGCRAVIVSNHAERVEGLKKRLTGMGFDLKHLAGIVTSGELTYNDLVRRRTAFVESTGETRPLAILWIDWHGRAAGGLEGFYKGLDGYTLATSVEEADFVMVSGAESIFAGTEAEIRTNFERDADEAPFMPTFRAAAERGLEMLCVNPDITVMSPEGWFRYMGGALAKHYEELGGKVTYYGKPYAACFEEARRILNASSEGEEPDRICHVGDSLHHDVLGASRVDGYDAAFVVRPGIHSKELPEKPSSEEIRELCSKEGTPVPDLAVPRFTW